jgi:ferritin
MAKKDSVTRVISDRLRAAFNTQVGNELQASNQYLAIAAHFANSGLNELAKFFHKQSDEERDHAVKFVRFLTEADEPVEIPAIGKPRAQFGSPLSIAQASLDWERTVTQQIYDLVDLAHADKSWIAMRFLDWFVNEQLEEMDLMKTLVDVIRAAGDNLLDVEQYLVRYGGGVAPNPIGGGE